MVVEFFQMEFKWLMSNWRVDIYRWAVLGRSHFFLTNVKRFNVNGKE